MKMVIVDGIRYRPEHPIAKARTTTKPKAGATDTKVDDDDDTELVEVNAKRIVRVKS